MEIDILGILKYLNHWKLKLMLFMNIYIKDIQKTKLELQPLHTSWEYNMINIPLFLVRLIICAGVEQIKNNNRVQNWSNAIT